MYCPISLQFLILITVVMSFVISVLNIEFYLEWLMNFLSCDLHYFVTEDSFQELQNDFMQRYYLDIDESDENKLFYTDIHKEYVIIKYYNGVLYFLCICINIFFFLVL